MTGPEREQATIKRTPPSIATEQVETLWGEIDFVFQEGLTNKELQKIADEVDELRRLVEACMESNELAYDLPSMTERR